MLYRSLRVCVHKIKRIVIFTLATKLNKIELDYE